MRDNTKVEFGISSDKEDNLKKAEKIISGRTK